MALCIMCRLMRALCVHGLKQGKRNRLPRYEKYATSSSAGLLTRIHSVVNVNGAQGHGVIRAVAVNAQTRMSHPH